jgi:hypothetical protein
VDKNGEQERAELKIFEPYPFSETGADFRCEFEVDGLGDGARRFADGVDSLQALQLALNVAAVYVESFRSKGMRIRWKFAAGDDLSLPFIDY